MTGMTRKLVGVLCVVLFIQGCATSVPFKQGKPVETQGNLISREYLQDGQPVTQDDMFEKLKVHENTAIADKAQAAQTWYYTSLFTGGIGGFLIGYFAIANNVATSDKITGALAGAGLVLVALGATYFSDKNSAEAVHLYNEGLGASTKKESSGLKLSPNIGFVEFHGQLNPTAGFALLF
jgi:hypothetical protein